MFSTGKLNVNTYLYAVEKMITANTNLLQELSDEKSEDKARVQKRLDILRQEHEKFKGKASQGRKSIDFCLINNFLVEKQAQETMSASSFFSKIDKMSPQELTRILESRIAQYWGLANYINDTIVSSLEPEVID